MKSLVYLVQTSIGCLAAAVDPVGVLVHAQIVDPDDSLEDITQRSRRNGALYIVAFVSMPNVVFSLRVTEGKARAVDYTTAVVEGGETLITECSALALHLASGDGLRREHDDADFHALASKTLVVGEA